MSDIDVLDTDDDSFQDSGSEYLPYGSNRSSSSDSEINDDFNNEITQEVCNNEITQDTASDENTELTSLKTRKRLLNKNNWKKM